MERSQIDAKYKWKLEDIYPDDRACIEDLNKAKEIAKKIAAYEGKVGESGKNLLAVLKGYDELDLLYSSTMCYSKMRLDQDNRDANYQKLCGEARHTIIETSAALAFVTPEIMGISDEKLAEFMADTKELSHYQFLLQNMRRAKEHTLSDKEERILAMAAESLNTPQTAFTSFNNADIKFGKIKNEDGELFELTHGSYVPSLSSSKRSVRKAAFKKMYKAFGDHANTLTALYSGQVKTDSFTANVRNYGSSLEAALFGENIAPEIYRNLVKTINDNLGYMDDYMKLRKRALGVKELHMYDVYNPIVKGSFKKYTFEEGWELVKAAIAPMGKEYCDMASTAFENGWIDAMENDGKTSGAYSWGCYSAPHPYIQMNWGFNIDSVFTLAHELGHAMHTYFSNKYQSSTYANYELVVAEVASTVNENLLADYLLKSSKDDDEKAYIINHYLEGFRTTIVRQTMFAEFELLEHDKVDRGEALTTEGLCEDYLNLNKKYFGVNMNVDDDIKYEWARIPHFYRPFYVYKYATGYSAAVVLAGNILSGDKKLLDQYLGFLKAGGSDYPTEILKRAGCDLTTPKPVESAMKKFGEMVKELGELI